jgi:glycosyltransferase involved in cell wall biosynthesis
MWAWFATVLLGGIVVVWFSYARALAAMARMPSLTAFVPSLPEGAAWPTLSVVVACRNEAAGVRAAIASLLAQDYPALELVAVNDRSDDATGAILDQLAATDARVQVVHVAELPSGWLGKTHALDRGASRATGDWMLFTDADVQFAPDALRRAIAWALRDQLGHAVALPRFVAPGLLERAFVSVFGLFFVLHLRLDRLHRPGSDAHVGIGAFNLVRRDAYLAIGGHRELRLEVADDVKLGLILRRSGVRQGAADSGGLVRVRWQAGFVASMRGLVKNFFAGCEYRWPAILRAIVLVPLATTFPLLSFALPLPPTARALALAATMLPMLLHGAVARRLADGRGHEGLLLPIVGLCLGAVAAASAAITTFRGGVVWRGTRYPLAELRAGGVRGRDWPAARAPGGYSSPRTSVMK